MSTYPERPLGEILHLELDEEPIEPERTYLTAGIYSHGRGLFKRPPIEGSQTSYSKYTKLHVGQFIYSKLFGWEGATAVVEPEFDGLYVSQEFPTFRINTALASPHYMGFLAQWNRLHFRLKDKGTGVGSRRQRVGVDRLLATPIPLPSLDEQRRIAARIDSSMERIAALTFAYNRAANLRAALTNSLFSSVDSQSPLNICLTPGGDSVTVDPGQDYQIAGIFSFGKGLIRRPAIRGSETSYAMLTKLHTGQLVMSKLNAWEGALAVVPEEFEASYVSPEYPVFDINHSTADPTYVANLATWPGLWERLTPRGSMVRRKRTSPSTLLTTVVPLPGLDEQRRIGNVFKKTTIFAELAEAQASRTSDLRSALLNVAFTGRF